MKCMVLIAVSTAVEPPVVKNTLLRSPGASSAIFFARIDDGSVTVVHGEAYGSFMACLAIASAISCLP